MRVGLVGTGYWARRVHGPSAARHPKVEFVGVWGRDKTKAAEAAAELGTRAYDHLVGLVADVDALMFAVPPDVQASIATQVATSFQKHLLLEKPVATSVLEALELEAAVQQAGVASVVFFTRRFVPEIQDWLRHVGSLGGWECGRAEIAAAIDAEGNPFGASPWRHDKGALWDVGPHALSVLWPVLGDITAVVASAGVRDQVHLVLEHAGGRSSTASLSLTVPSAATGGATYVYGEHGREVAPAGPFDPVAAHGAALDALIAQAAAVTPAHACDVHFGVRVVEVLGAAEQSLRSGRRVEVVPGRVDIY